MCVCVCVHVRIFRLCSCSPVGADTLRRPIVHPEVSVREYLKPAERSPVAALLWDALPPQQCPAEHPLCKPYIVWSLTAGISRSTETFRIENFWYTTFWLRTFQRPFFRNVGQRFQVDTSHPIWTESLIFLVRKDGASLVRLPSSVCSAVHVLPADKIVMCFILVSFDLWHLASNFVILYFWS